MDQLLLTAFVSLITLAAIGQAAPGHFHHDPHDKLYAPPGGKHK